MHNMMQCTMQNTAKSQCNKVDQVGCIIINATEVKRARLAVGRSACNPRIRIIALVSDICSILYTTHFHVFLSYNHPLYLTPHSLCIPPRTSTMHHALVSADTLSSS